MSLYVVVNDFGVLSVLFWVLRTDGFWEFWRGIVSMDFGVFIEDIVG